MSVERYALQALLATGFTWGMTALGAGVVFLFGQVRQKLLDAMLGISAGVMLAASYFSLLEPAAEMARALNRSEWLILPSGFGCGAMLFCAAEHFWKKRLMNRVSQNDKHRRVIMLILAITLHNIPEGMAVGVAFGSLAYGLEECTAASAAMLALGIGLQNFPEGAAVSLPLLREGISRKKAFFFGQLSAVVEPIFGFLGALLVIRIRSILPFLLSFAAGAMVFVVVEELLPESRGREDGGLWSSFMVLCGFLVMMVMDLALG